MSFTFPLMTAVSVAELVDAAARLISVESGDVPSIQTAFMSRSVRVELLATMMSLPLFSDSRILLSLVLEA